ncbi:MAG: hypothetical protein HKN36_10605 [Hellea sp.]|nr:hypothetical protein [Hellea sp.]
MPTKIKKILIANRGEIACRVIKTAHTHPLPMGEVGPARSVGIAG